MKLREYVERLAKEGLDAEVRVPGHEVLTEEDLNTEIEWLSCDSRNVKPGTLFVCKGVAFKPEYLQQAVEKGAVAYVQGKDRQK